jgi:hypothetical protein
MGNLREGVERGGDFQGLGEWLVNSVLKLPHNLTQPFPQGRHFAAGLLGVLNAGHGAFHGDPDRLRAAVDFLGGLALLLRCGGDLGGHLVDGGDGGDDVAQGLSRLGRFDGGIRGRSAGVIRAA